MSLTEDFDMIGEDVGEIADDLPSEVGDTVDLAAPDPATRAPGLGRTQLGHGARLDPRWSPDGGAPAPVRRPRPLAAGPHRRPVRERASDEPQVTFEPEATVFTNIAPGSSDVVRPWVEALRNVGFAVFAKPKVDDDSDVDADMLEHIALRRREGLASVFVGVRRRSGVPAAARGHRPGRHPRQRSRISRTCELGASVGYLGVRRPRRHLWCLPGAVTANQP